MSPFEDIRPFNDEEVNAVVRRILDDPEFISAITAFKFSSWPRWTRPLLKPLVKSRLEHDLGALETVGQVQQVCSHYLDAVIEKTISKITISGLENLDKNTPYLFISNHRDIVMDPAFVNYALYHNGYDTLRIAIGDNLLQKPFVSDLMRLNKSFIVKRSATGVREKMQAYTLLSQYIFHSISEGKPIWIAQREGRAKNGIDKTDPAIIKMLFMSQKKSDKSFSEYINWLNIVPVVISYEYNPCDQLIANELYQKQALGSYKKQPGEDIHSIVTGITGHKGHVHVAFGQAIKGSFGDADLVASAIDQQMRANQVLHPSNHLAANLVDAQYNLSDKKISNEAQDQFNARVQSCDETVRPYLLALYANSALHQ